MEMTETRAEGTAPQAQRRMTAEDYERDRQRIRAIYGDNSAEAGAQRDQALAALYHRSGWTQEELAKAEGVNQKTIQRRILFGLFLTFRPDGLKAKNLSEGRFRSYWEQTDKTEQNHRIRFQAVLRLIEKDTWLSKSNAKKHEVGDSIMADFADGKWHKLATIEAHVHEKVQASAEDVHTVLEGMERKGNYGSHCEQKQVGTSHAYRIVRKSGKSVDVDVLTKELEPILERMKEQGRANVATFSPSAISLCVVLIQNLISKLAK